MQPIDEEFLESLIKEAKEAGKDVSKLEEALILVREPIEAAGPIEAVTLMEARPKQGERKKVKETERGTIIIESTGPAREEDFE
jgi:hypothetical protein